LETDLLPRRKTVRNIRKCFPFLVILIATVVLFLSASAQERDPSSLAPAQTFMSRTVAAPPAPGPVTIDSATGDAYVVGQVINYQGQFKGKYTADVLGPNGNILATVILDGTPDYWGNYPRANNKVYVPLFAPEGTTSVAMDAISTVNYTVTRIMVPNITQTNIATAASNGNVVVLAQGTDDFTHVILVAPDSTIENNLALYNQATLGGYSR
jgi:hypothetical protein